MGGGWGSVVGWWECCCAGCVWCLCVCVLLCSPLPSGMPRVVRESYYLVQRRDMGGGWGSVVGWWECCCAGCVWCLCVCSECVCMVCVVQSVCVCVCVCKVCV